MKSGPKKGTLMGGIQTLEDIRQRCVIDDITGCWNYGRNNAGLPQFWIPALQRRMSGGSTLRWLVKGQPNSDGKWWVCGCDNMRCMNPKHRLVVSAAEGRRLANATRPLAVRAKAAEAMRKVSTRIPEEVVQRVLQDEGTTKEIASRHGLDCSYVARLRRQGGRSPRGAVANSVFAWRPA